MGKRKEEWKFSLSENKEKNFMIRFIEKMKMENSIFVIHPYKYKGTWVFDDESKGLVKEPFVSGIPEMIEELVKDLADADKGFRLVFSANPFPGYKIKLEKVTSEFGGTWYKSDDLVKTGWLCPALFKYFETAPETIYSGL